MNPLKIVEFNIIPQVTDKLLDQLSQIVRKTALDVEKDAAQRTPVDTGFLKSSIYSVTSAGSTYPNVPAPTDEDATKLKETGPVTNPYEAYVGVAANYGIYVEFGTHKMASQPYFIPALEAQDANFEDQCSKIESKLRV